MKKVLFLAINYQIECAEHGDKIVNGYTKHSEELVKSLSKIADMTIAADRKMPDECGEIKLVNIFRETTQDISDVLNFWKDCFGVYTKESKVFSRDTIYRVINMANVLDINKLRDLLYKENFDLIIFNRHEFFFLSLLPMFSNIKKCHIAHDSLFLRKKTYADFFKTDQPLLGIEKSIENELILKTDLLVTISPDEEKYFRSINDNTDIVLFRPSIRLLGNMKIINSAEPINLYFLGVNHLANRQALNDALITIERSGVWSHFKFIFNIIGTISEMDIALPLNFKIVKHGHVENIEKFMRKMDILVCPIKIGSGSPIKISEALSSGHFVFTNEFGSGAYREFIGKRVFIDNDFAVAFHKIVSVKSDTDSAYKEYARANEEAVKKIVSIN